MQSSISVATVDKDSSGLFVCKSLRTVDGYAQASQAPVSEGNNSIYTLCSSVSCNRGKGFGSVFLKLLQSNANFGQMNTVNILLQV